MLWCRTDLRPRAVSTRSHPSSSVPSVVPSRRRSYRSNDHGPTRCHIHVCHTDGMIQSFAFGKRFMLFFWRSTALLLTRVGLAMDSSLIHRGPYLPCVPRHIDSHPLGGGVARLAEHHTLRFGWSVVAVVGESDPRLPGASLFAPYGSP
jgi:hypothetical protein